MIRIQNITLGLNESEDKLKAKLSKTLRLSMSDIKSMTIFKKALDARKKDAIKWVYTVDLETTKDDFFLSKNIGIPAPDMTYYYPEKGTQTLKHRPVIVGAGPCGMFAALILAQMGYKPIIVERGGAVEQRTQDVQDFWKKGKLNPNSNVQFGEGGAGTFSDGKLTTQIKNKRCHKVLQELADAGAPQEIRYNSKPHIGTDILQVVVKNIRKQIEDLGGTYRFNTCVTNIKVEDNKLKAIELNHNEWLDTDVCVMALGHSARDTFKMLYENKLMVEQKPFAMGMRIEHLQDWMNTAQYGEKYNPELLGAADYKLVHHCSNGRAVYSFCMCPGGYVVASASEPEMVVTNGMSEYKRDADNANSAILINISPADFGSQHPLAGMEFQRELERLAYTLGGNNYHAPCQTVGDYLDNVTTTEYGVVKPSYEPGTVGANLREALPDFMSEAVAEALVAFGRKIKGFDHKEALLTGFETRSSSPIRMNRDGSYESNIEGLYPAGEGAGYAGGITSAAVDGIEVAEAIISRYKGV